MLSKYLDLIPHSMHRINPVLNCWHLEQRVVFWILLCQPPLEKSVLCVCVSQDSLATAWILLPIGAGRIFRRRMLMLKWSWGFCMSGRRAKIGHQRDSKSLNEYFQRNGSDKKEVKCRNSRGWKLHYRLCWSQLQGKQWTLWGLLHHYFNFVQLSILVHCIKLFRFA